MRKIGVVAGFHNILFLTIFRMGTILKQVSLTFKNIFSHAMSELFESVCKQADENKDDIAMIHQLWLILKTNKSRLTEIEFDFAREHLGQYYEACENRIDGKNFEQETKG